MRLFLFIVKTFFMQNNPYTYAFHYFDDRYSFFKIYHILAMVITLSTFLNTEKRRCKIMVLIAISSYSAFLSSIRVATKELSIAFATRSYTRIILILLCHNKKSPLPVNISTSNLADIIYLRAYREDNHKNNMLFHYKKKILFVTEIFVTFT